VIHSFPAATDDGHTPVSTPCVDPSSGLVYVTCQTGGKYGKGGVVCLNPNKAGYAVVHSFNGTDGAYPTGALLVVPQGSTAPSYLYGTTLRGGRAATGATGNQGTIFRVTTDGSVFQTLHVFTGTPTDGASPHAGLILASDNNLYGTTLAGGKYGLGTLFVSTLTGRTTVLHHFTGQATGDLIDGAKPYARLLEYHAGSLVGTTAEGGRSGFGTVFSYVPKARAYAVVHNFAGGTTDGANPTSELTAAMEATGAPVLAGTTSNGGANGGGTAYLTDSSLKTFTLIYSFGAPGDAADPRAGLAFNAQTGDLYGTSRSGGAFGDGSVFELLPAVQTQETVLYSFNPFGSTGDGGAPLGGLALSPIDGLFYGTCSTEGINFGGTAYSLAP
jgi:uncharacterized repeat protein (TIGR03803 family)